MEKIRKTSDKVKTDLLVDISIFLAFLVAMDPRSTGIAIHEWLSIALAAAAILHLLLHWTWIANVTLRFLRRVTSQTRINYILNILLFIDFTIIMFTGIMISESALPALGIRLGESFAWRTLHSLSADISVFILGLHVALHWRWIISTFKRYIFKFPIRKHTAPTPVVIEENGL